MAYPRFQLARGFKMRRDVTTSSLSYTSTDFIELATVTNGPGAGGYDIVLAAQVGDVIEYVPRLYWSNEAATSHLDVATIVAGAVVNTFAQAGTFGVWGWEGPRDVFRPIGIPAHYTIVAGDLSGGAVTLRPRVKSGDFVQKNILRGASYPVVFVAKNLGPVDPN